MCKCSVKEINEKKNKKLKNKKSMLCWEVFNWNTRKKRAENTRVDSRTQGSKEDPREDAHTEDNIQDPINEDTY